jgi:hypothetical protein
MDRDDFTTLVIVTLILGISFIIGTITQNIYHCPAQNTSLGYSTNAQMICNGDGVFVYIPSYMQNLSFSVRDRGLYAMNGTQEAFAVTGC